MKQQEIAKWLQDMLGNDYSVKYDDCESCLTRVYFKPLNKLIAEVPNNEMKPGISVQNFEASREDRMMAMVTNR